MATRARLEQALINADAAGDVEAAKVFAAAIRNGQYDDNTQQEQSIPQSPQDQNKDRSIIGDINQAIISNPVGRGAAEFASSFNRGALGLVDVATSPINAALDVAGSNYRIPSAVESLKSATQGNFMEQGLGRDVVRGVGEVIPSGVAVGGAIRSLATPLTGAVSGQIGNVGTLPSLASGAESVGAGVLRQMGQSTAAQDAVYSGLSGGGGAIGREYGGDIGAIAGSILTPIAAASLASSPSLIKSAIDNAGEIAMTKEAAPTIDTLKNTAREVYKEIDDLGAVVSSSRFDGLVGDLKSTIRGEGFNKKIHPKVAAAMDEISSAYGVNQKVTNIDTLRKVARSAAASIEPDEARIGNIMVSKIDDFMDNIKDSDLVGGSSANIGEKYRHARQLWQRARKAEDIDVIIDKAKNQASGFENGLRTQFRSLLNNKKKIKMYSPSEVEAIQKVVRGGGVENVAKAIGKFGFSEGQATSMLLGSLGVAGGAAVGGGAGAVAVPLIGQVSKNLAQKLTRNNAEMVSHIVRSGKDATRITKSYFSMVPASQRSPYELAELLLSTGATDSIKIQAKSEPLKKFISETGVLVGAAQNQKEDKK